MNIASYIQERLNHGNTIKNFQAWMLARYACNPEDRICLRKVAIDEINQLPVVGLVESFNESISNYNRWLSTYFPKIIMKPSHLNKTNEIQLLSSRLAYLKNRIGNELYSKILAENRIGIELYRIVKSRYS
jgi:hypothetical protein